MWAYLPGLQQLTVHGSASGGEKALWFAPGDNCATRPLQLNLDGRLYKKMGLKLDQQGRWKHVPQVTVALCS
jgi:hypothetical protein